MTGDQGEPTRKRRVYSREKAEATAAYLNKYGKQRELYRWGIAPYQWGWELRTFRRNDRAAA